ncbi:MAG: BMP family ABC transporter substrate-binding protein, partial [Firmicutes bacterium]|nr:BMP family ABC transporter substrate-binding protein [Bacillota bacterium]
MKKVLAVLLVLAMVFALAACGNGGNTTPQNNANESNTNNTTPEPTVYNVGMVCIGDDNAAYDRNFYMAADAAKELLAKEGINIEWIKTYHHPEGQEVADDCEELAGEKKCIAVFLNSYGQEPAMLQIAADYPDTVFAGLTNEGSWKDELDNTINAFPSIYEGRYLAGV